MADLLGPEHRKHSMKITTYNLRAKNSTIPEKFKTFGTFPKLLINYDNRQ
jgi:hypothetical protein